MMALLNNDNTTTKVDNNDQSCNWNEWWWIRLVDTWISISEDSISFRTLLIIITTVPQDVKRERERQVKAHRVCGKSLGDDNDGPRLSIGKCKSILFRFTYILLRHRVAAPQWQLVSQWSLVISRKWRRWELDWHEEMRRDLFAHLYSDKHVEFLDSPLG